MGLRLPRLLHRWTLSVRGAMAVQRRLASRVVERTPEDRPLRWVAGLDAAFADEGRICVGAVVVWDRELQQVVETQVARRQVRFPYIPGLLSFREAPALLAALRRLKCRPDVLMCDGQGRAHPRRFGIACHLGVLCELPALGCAKSRLVGRHQEPGVSRGSSAILVDGGEVVGEVLRTRDGVRPVYVSVGHRLDLGTARELVLACAIRFRLPEPTRLADRVVAEAGR